MFLGTASAQDVRPNILLLIADDLGLADLGIYGAAELRTPNIDSLADGGLLLTQFHASPLCSTTRAMLFSGNNNHVAGLARQGTFPGAVIPGLAGYENELSDRVALLPRLLNDAGYRTYMAGKWHLGSRQDNSPMAAGFERSFAMLEGSGSHFSGIGNRPGAAHYREDDALVDWEEGAYSTAVYTDKLLGYLDADRDDDRPFFMVAAYTSPHWPLQVPDEDLDLYAGQYEMGYDALREQRFESLQAAGIVPQDSRLPPRNPDIRPWDDLSAAEQRRESRKMEIYAAMIDNLDRHIGRLFDYLRSTEQFDNTLIIFMSDNGAAAEDFYYRGNPVLVEYIREHFDDSTERMGRMRNFVSYGPQWAEAGSAPYRLHKGYPTQGGIVTPMILKGPFVERRDEKSDVYLSVMDLMPTFLEIAGAAYPEDKTPMLGESALAWLSGSAGRVHADDYVTTFNYNQRSSVRQGDWKLMSLAQPFDERGFALYNLADDPGETTDLSAQLPDKRAAMLELWRQERRRLGITLPEDL